MPDHDSPKYFSAVHNHPPARDAERGVVMESHIEKNPRGGADRIVVELEPGHKLVVGSSAKGKHPVSDAFEKTILRDFIEENWSLFQRFCEPHGGELAKEIIVSLGGDPD